MYFRFSPLAKIFIWPSSLMEVWWSLANMMGRCWKSSVGNEVEGEVPLDMQSDGEMKRNALDKPLPMKSPSFPLFMTWPNSPLSLISQVGIKRVPKVSIRHVHLQGYEVTCHVESSPRIDTSKVQILSMSSTFLIISFIFLMACLMVQ